MYKREVGKPRSDLDYRPTRRNLSKLGAKDRNWFGTETKLRKDPPPLILKKSERGEAHYVELWD